jgi:hypothetical protein
MQSDTMGQNLLPILPFLKIYKDYFNNYEKCAQVIRAAKKQDKKFHEWIVKTEKKARQEKKLDMQSLMIAPVQRIPKYNLLLKELVKNTDSTHTDYENITKALQGTVDITDFLNKKMREMRKDAIKEKLITTLKFEDETVLDMMLKPSSKYLGEGKLDLLESTRAITPFDINNQYHYILLSDMLLVCEKQEAVPQEPMNTPRRGLQSRLSIQWDRKSLFNVDYKMGAQALETEIQNFSVIHYICLRGENTTWVKHWKVFPLWFKLITNEGSILFKCQSEEEQVHWVENLEQLAAEGGAKPLAKDRLQSQVVLGEAATIVQSVYHGIRERKRRVELASLPREVLTVTHSENEDAEEHHEDSEKITKKPPPVPVKPAQLALHVHEEVIPQEPVEQVIEETSECKTEVVMYVLCCFYSSVHIIVSAKGLQTVPGRHVLKAHFPSSHTSKSFPLQRN